MEVFATTILGNQLTATLSCSSTKDIIKFISPIEDCSLQSFCLTINPSTSDYYSTTILSTISPKLVPSTGTVSVTVPLNVNVSLISPTDITNSFMLGGISLSSEKKEIAANTKTYSGFRQKLQQKFSSSAISFGKPSQKIKIVEEKKIASLAANLYGDDSDEDGDMIDEDGLLSAVPVPAATAAQGAKEDDCGGR